MLAFRFFFFFRSFFFLPWSAWLSPEFTALSLASVSSFFGTFYSAAFWSLAASLSSYWTASLYAPSTFSFDPDPWDWTLASTLTFAEPFDPVESSCWLLNCISPSMSCLLTEILNGLASLSAFFFSYFNFLFFSFSEVKSIWSISDWSFSFVYCLSICF